MTSMASAGNEPAPELVKLHNRCRAVVDFCEKRFRSSADRAFMASFGLLVEEALAGGDLPGMKMLYKELERLAEHLEPADTLELQALLAALPVDPGLDESEVKTKVSEILGRGAIETMDEYVLLRGLIDHEAPEGRMSPELEARVIELVGAYERQIQI